MTNKVEEIEGGGSKSRESVINDVSAYMKARNEARLAQQASAASVEKPAAQKAADPSAALFTDQASFTSSVGRNAVTAAAQESVKSSMPAPAKTEAPTTELMVRFPSISAVKVEIQAAKGGESGNEVGLSGKVNGVDDPNEALATFNRGYNNALRALERGKQKAEEHDDEGAAKDFKLGIRNARMAIAAIKERPSMADKKAQACELLGQLCELMAKQFHHSEAIA